MEINDLFGNQSKQNNYIANKPKDISVIDSIITQPLTYGLDKKFNCIKDTPQGSCDRLREGQVDFGMISSLDYSKGKGNWKIIPDICISSMGPGNFINLFFNKEIRKIGKIAINQDDITSNTLLKILMREKYEIIPEYVTIEGGLKDKLKKADAAILTGNQAFQYQQSNNFYLDLCDEWFDFTGLPFVYAFWVVNEISIDDEYITTIQNSIKNINSNIRASSKELAKGNNGDIEEYINYFKNIFTYPLGNEENYGINEFFRYAFFFGIIDHIPDLHYLR